MLDFCETIRKEKLAKDAQCWIKNFLGTDDTKDSETFEKDLWEWVTETDEGHALKE